MKESFLFCQRAVEISRILPIFAFSVQLLLFLSQLTSYLQILYPLLCRKREFLNHLLSYTNLLNSGFLPKFNNKLTSIVVALFFNPTNSINSTNPNRVHLCESVARWLLYLLIGMLFPLIVSPKLPFKIF